MNQKNKKITTYFVIFSLLLIGIIYAILQANLQINGIAKIGANTWDIHFDNIQVNTDSVAIGTGDSGAVIDSENNCKIDFEVTLSTPGDYYEFTVDVVNAGTIDGMIGELTKTIKVNNETVSDIPDYLDYSVTYSDGLEILPNHGLSAGTTETYLVRLEFRSDIEELPAAATVETTLEPQYIQADSNVIVVNHPVSLYSVFQTEASNGLVAEYTGSHQDSFTAIGIQKIYHWYADNSNEADEIRNKWNVLFAGFCWQMWRTTDTGGIKLIYNGVPSEGKCTATGTGQQIGTSAYNTNYKSPAYVGYMYNPNTLVTYTGNTAATSGSLFGTSVSYSNGTYTLTSTSTTYDATHHYTCNNTTGSCSTIRYYFYDNFYLQLSDGRNIEETLEDMLSADDVNQTNSTIKTSVDTWYQNNMTTYTSKLEDTIFCNDRIVTDTGGWNPNGGGKYSYLYFKNYDTTSDLSCTNVTDQFSMSNSKAQLTYPVGLMTLSEANLFNNYSLKSTGQTYWLVSPAFYKTNNDYGTAIYTSGMDYNNVYYANGVRPAISLMPGTEAVSGDGSKNNPYIVE